MVLARIYSTEVPSSIRRRCTPNCTSLGQPLIVAVAIYHRATQQFLGEADDILFPRNGACLPAPSILQYRNL